MHEPVHPMLIVAGVLGGVMLVAPGLIWLERRLLALWQDRYGPNRAGPFGLLVVLADTLKLFFKEDWIPPFADRKVFVIAPAIVMMAALMGFVVVPFAPGFIVSDLPWAHTALSSEDGRPTISTPSLAPCAEQRR
jgi:NADH-quinone oxidoreductase subunit H